MSALVAEPPSSLWFSGRRTAGEPNRSADSFLSLFMYGALLTKMLGWIVPAGLWIWSWQLRTVLHRDGLCLCLQLDFKLALSLRFLSK